MTCLPHERVAIFNVIAIFPRDEFQIQGYSDLIFKADSHNRHGHGLGVYIKDGTQWGV